MKQGKGNRNAIRAALDKLGPAPIAPLAPMLTSTEPTFEGLCKQFPTHHPSLGIFASEGGQFIGGHGMKDDNKLRTASGLSGLWDGEPARRVRAGDGATFYPGRRVAVHLMVQPNVASILFSDPLAAGPPGTACAAVGRRACKCGRKEAAAPRASRDRCHLEKYGADLLKISGGGLCRP